MNVTAVVATDVDNDLALLRPKEKLEAGLSIVDDKALVAIGDTVAFIGYPGGYEGAMPMLGVGHIAAVGPHPSVKPGKQEVRGFVNGAFNRGNIVQPSDLDSRPVASHSSWPSRRSHPACASLSTCLTTRKPKNA